MKADDISTALHLMARLDLTIADLSAADHRVETAPTFAEYTERLRESVAPSTARSYGPYWRKLVEAWGDRRLDEPAPLEIERLINEHREKAVRRSNSRNGHGAAMTYVSAVRCLYRNAERDRLISPSQNPAVTIRKPRPLPTPRHALSLDQIHALADIASTTGNDPHLDALIIRLHIETACRRGGALALRVDDINETDCLLRLCEKGNTLRWQPVSPTLMRHIIHHVHSRGGTESTRRLLRYRSGKPVGRRRYDYLRERFHTHLPWAAALGVTAHWIRHTTLTFVERQSGMAVARAYAGHATAEAPRGHVVELGGNSGATHIYVRATLVEVAEALEVLTGEQHPLARRHRHPLTA